MKRFFRRLVAVLCAPILGLAALLVVLAMAYEGEAKTAYEAGDEALAARLRRRAAWLDWALPFCTWVVSREDAMWDVEGHREG